MLPNFARQETLFQQQIMCLGNKNMFLNQVKKHVCFTDATFNSETYVFQLSRRRNNCIHLATRAAKHTIDDNL